MNLVPFPTRMFRPTPGLMDRWFDDMLGEGNMSTGGWYPATDIAESDAAFVLKTDLPDVDPEKIEISVHNNALSLKGERSEETESEEGEYHRVERMKGAFSRTFSLPDGVDADAVSAGYDKGVLTITIPKRKVESATPRTIKVG